MMAEAPKGSPRKTTTYKEFSGMNSQDARYGVEKEEFFWLENIMRVADGRLKSVPGPSAVVAQFFGGDFLLQTDDSLVLQTTDDPIELV